MNLTNQQLLSELEKRLPFFAESEIMSLIKLIMTSLPYGYKEKLLQLNSQQVNDFMKKSIQEIEQEKINKQVAEAKKVLGYEEREKK